ncbi:L,D-transpeptidase [Bradyrhizobium sp. WSM1417]|uniref:L,D-transpeptidase n=1 Tax=Bradyrhizobium sp. WSM1417 TaxID=754500 RepID=UPI000A038712|nr:L,D-transpeptidase [Bradyrhizobium sp. WSM1417]
MSKLIYHGTTHQIELRDDKGASLGSWAAYNNIDSAFAKSNYHSARHLDNGSYKVADTTEPYPHAADSNGPYGSHGIIRFNYPGHPGVGLHSGRADATNMPGPQHATHGCIRTTDEAMETIAGIIKNDPLTTIAVQGNNKHVAKQGAPKHHAIRHKNKGHFNPQKAPGNAANRKPKT